MHCRCPVALRLFTHPAIRSRSNSQKRQRGTVLFIRALPSARHRISVPSAATLAYFTDGTEIVEDAPAQASTMTSGSASPLLTLSADNWGASLFANI
jgi:hypothetical protein